MPLKNNFNTPCSPSALTMDSSPPSEVEYAKRVATLNDQMDIEMSNLSMDYTGYNVPQQTHGDSEAAPNALCQIDPSMLPLSPSTIPYEANAPADPNLWDGYFGAISLFSTNEFLQSNTQNISCSLICMAEFIKQRNITNHDRNKIPQLESFGEAALTFIQAIHKVGWDRLNTPNMTTLRHKIKLQFAESGPPSTNTDKRNLVEKNPFPIPAHLP